MKMENKEKTVIISGGSNKEAVQKAKEMINSKIVEIAIIKDLTKLKETPEYIPINYPGYKYATLINGVPVVIHENGQMLIIQNTTGKKRHEIIKHINQLVKDGVVELRESDKEIHFIDNKMVCDIKKLLKEQK